MLPGSLLGAGLTVVLALTPCYPYSLAAATVETGQLERDLVAAALGARCQRCVAVPYKKLILAGTNPNKTSTLATLLEGVDLAFDIR